MREVETPWRVVQARVHVSLPPHLLSDAVEAATRLAYGNLLLRYNASLGGVVTAISSPLVLQKAPVIVGASPFAHVRASATLLLFSPQPNTILSGMVNYVGPGHVGISVHANFHATLPAACAPNYAYAGKDAKSWTYGVQEGDDRDTSLDIRAGCCIRFRVSNVKFTSSGLFQMIASIAALEPDPNDKPNGNAENEEGQHDEQQQPDSHLGVIVDLDSYSASERAWDRYGQYGGDEGGFGHDNSEGFADESDDVLHRMQKKTTERRRAVSAANPLLSGANPFGSALNPNRRRTTGQLPSDTVTPAHHGEIISVQPLDQADDTEDVAQDEEKEEQGPQSARKEKKKKLASSDKKKSKKKKRESNDNEDGESGKENANGEQKSSMKTVARTTQLVNKTSKLNGNDSRNGNGTDDDDPSQATLDPSSSPSSAKRKNKKPSKTRPSSATAKQEHSVKHEAKHEDDDMEDVLVPESQPLDNIPSPTPLVTQVSQTESLELALDNDDDVVLPTPVHSPPPPPVHAMSSRKAEKPKKRKRSTSAPDATEGSSTKKKKKKRKADKDSRQLSAIEFARKRGKK